MRVGHGYDIHRLVEGRVLVLGGQHIDYPRGLLGHSDGDVVCHAIIDSLLGALALPDIGQTFPDQDPKLLGENSCGLLRTVFAEMIQPKGYQISNIDTTIIAQAPVLAPYTSAMRHHLAPILDTEPHNISIKAKTNEGLDSIGGDKAIACYAVCLLLKI
ncbi:MAG: 2-C-methyl-D-erythritol 2,4-cyclodiphosphate synthase [Verrucomicrobiota bacterium]|nr:MAG: 2-C-methyl-D-erythritol 2,4-cyclodiphosphate synthase [Verrucomicrobiota bacterium]